MAQMQQSLEITRPLEEVFAFVADPGNDARWSASRGEVALDLPPGGGHRGYAAMVDGSGLMAACCCSHWMGGK